jgi:hypothetical protein
MDEKIPEAKVCESCSNKFGCGANLDGCWCAELTISDDAAAELKEKFDDCLCPDCLARFEKAVPRVG